jgi:predicted ester cyclase
MSVPASNKAFKTEQLHVYRIANGKIVEHWAGRDDFGLMRQLGHVPFGGAR